MEITINNHIITITQEPQTQYYAPITKEIILDYLREIKPALAKDGVTKLGLFGSYANGYASKIRSDIDIAIEMNDKFHKNFNEIVENIEAHFHRKVDICDLKYCGKKQGRENFFRGAIYV